MNKNKKKSIAIALIILAVVLIITTFFKNDSSAIVGKWELSPTEKYGYDVYEFHKDSTGIMYRVTNNGDAYDSETFNYKLHDSKITIDMFGVSRVYSYEISGKNLLIDNKLYGKSSGSNSFPWIRFVLLIACLIGAFVIYKSNNSLTKKTISNTEPIPKVSSVPKTPSIPTPISTVEPEPAIASASSSKPDKTTASVETGKLKSTFKPFSEVKVPLAGPNTKEIPKSVSDNDWFKSAGDL